ncbi:DNA/RNA non-specific endonuclease [Mycolicibacterium neworleansense]|uniref:Serine protease n=1 Tax=Mycolicibacterium neworleansense TaxID=146018 RepID=A0A0H5S6H7_9MYCO|nr:DNA/RNA non-specific endonuclease [Mycolicibacterium neworleansense]MCV7361448.1 DNA/RNA non-specific endonuclease [Mycolicibacterium neworleansense]CRZ16799.1 Nuclease precursor [Mycolicibacterium neworleansense]
MSNVFLEPDHRRLVRRVAAITEGDLTSTQISKVVDGDLDLLKNLPQSGKDKVAALLKPQMRDQLRKIIGPTTDFVPICFIDRAGLSARAVARVIDGKRRPLGTGVMVSPRLFMTNNHVIAEAQSAASTSIQFNYQLDIDDVPAPVTEFGLDPETFFWTSPEDELDVSLIAVGPRTAGDGNLSDFGWTALSSALDKHAEGDHVTIIEHPDADYKQIALRENRVMGRGKKGATLYYAADTLHGSSGSPVFNDQFVLVALHHAGGGRNDTELEDGRPVPEECNEGIRTSAIVDALRARHDQLPSALRDLLAEALNPPAAGTPLEVTAAAAVIDDVSNPAQPSVLERNDAPNPDYSNRSGYDPDFLSKAVAVPVIPTKLLAKCAVPDGLKRSTANVVLRYHHFSLVIRADRRMPLFTIVNIDGRRLRKIKRETGEVEAVETWYTDPRLHPELQLDQDVFERQKPRLFDRGHMVRRLDPAWGSAVAAKQGTDDTFHFANCCPQISAFNQHLWARIENYALVNAGAEKRQITVITGPVFGGNDPLYRGVNVPRQFWKIVVRVSAADGDLRATAFLADQNAALDAAFGSGTESFTDIDKVVMFQKSVADIERLSGLSFGVLRDHDTMTVGLKTIAPPLSSLDEAGW